MSTEQKTETQPPSTRGESRTDGKRVHGRLAAFLVADHRYVYLGTSVLALLGLVLAGRPGSSWSFLARAPLAGTALDVVLVAWLVLSAVALALKLARWGTYAAESPLRGPAAVRASRIASYVVWAAVAVLFVDRSVMGFCSLVEQSVAAESNPQDFLSSAVYMVYESRGIFVSGIVTTIELAIFGTIIAFALALLMVFLRIQIPDRSDNDAVKFLKVVGSGFAKVYSTVIRGTPMMVQGLLFYYIGFAAFRGSGMSVTQIGQIWSTFVAGLVTISLNSTAYMMEVLRGGIESVDVGQTEAARSLGLSQWQAMKKVVFPQGIKYSIPALSNELVINIKDSSVLSVIGVFDLMFATTTVAGIYYRQMEVYCVAAVCYLILTLVASKVLTTLSRRLEVEEPGVVPSSN